MEMFRLLSLAFLLPLLHPHVSLQLTMCVSFFDKVQGGSSFLEGLWAVQERNWGDAIGGKQTGSWVLSNFQLPE